MSETPRLYYTCIPDAPESEEDEATKTEGPLRRHHACYQQTEEFMHSYMLNSVSLVVLCAVTWKKQGLIPQL